MTWERRAPFVSSALEQAFWLGSLAVVGDAQRLERVVSAIMEMLESARPRARA